jgi:hypothetical protein
MKPGNFNWFLHTMLFYHTKHVLARAKEKARKRQHNSDDEDDNSD